MNRAIYKYLFRIIPNKNGKSYFYGSFLVLKKTVDLLIGYKVGLQLTNFCFTASLFVVKLIYLLCFIRSNISDSTSYMKEQHIKRYMFLKKHVKFINVPTYNHSFKHDYEWLVMILILILILASIAWWLFVITENLHYKI